MGRAAVAGTRTAIDGVWTMNATRDQVVKEMMARQRLTKAMAESDLVSENYGRWRFAFDRGRLYYTQAAEGSSAGRAPATRSTATRSPSP